MVNWVWFSEYHVKECALLHSGDGSPTGAAGGHAGRLSVRLGLESILALLSAESLPAPPPLAGPGPLWSRAPRAGLVPDGVHGVQRDCCAWAICVPGEPAAAAAQILLARFDIVLGTARRALRVGVTRGEPCLPRIPRITALIYCELEPTAIE